MFSLLLCLGKVKQWKNGFLKPEESQDYRANDMVFSLCTTHGRMEKQESYTGHMPKHMKHFIPNDIDIDIRLILKRNMNGATIDKRFETCNNSKHCFEMYNI